MEDPNKVKEMVTRRVEIRIMMQTLQCVAAMMPRHTAPGASGSKPVYSTTTGHIYNSAGMCKHANVILDSYSYSRYTFLKCRYTFKYSGAYIKHQSIHFPAYPIQGCLETGAYPSCRRAKYPLEESIAEFQGGLLMGQHPQTCSVQNFIWKFG